MSINRDEYLFILLPVQWASETFTQQCLLHQCSLKNRRYNTCGKSSILPLLLTIEWELSGCSVGMMGDNGVMTPRDIIILCLLYEKTEKNKTNRCLFRWDSLSLLLHFRSMWRFKLPPSFRYFMTSNGVNHIPQINLISWFSDVVVSGRTDHTSSDTEFLNWK